MSITTKYTPNSNNMRFGSTNGLINVSGFVGGSGGSSGSVGGTNGAIQFNNNGVLGGDAAIASISTSTSNVSFGSSTGTGTVNSKASQVSIAPPSNISITAGTETAVTLPSSINATQVNPPDDSLGANLQANQNDSGGSYFSDGSVNISYSIYAYILTVGNYYYFGTPSTVAFTDSNSGNFFSVDLAWSAVSGATGYVLQASGSSSQGNPNWIINVGNVTSYVDNGSLSGADSIPTDWNTAAFFPPTTPVADSPTSLNLSTSTGYATYPDDGSIFNITITVYAYDDSNPTIYYSNSSTSNSVLPPGMGGTFGVDASWTSGGTQSGYKLITIVTYNSLPPVEGSMTTTSDTQNDVTMSSGDVTVTPTVSQFNAQTTRVYRAYGYLTSPLTYYTTTFQDYQFTDNAPSNGYMILHSITYSSTPNVKVLGQYDGQGYSNSFSSSSTQVLENTNNIWLGNTVVTPQHVGILSSGQTWLFRAYARNVSPSYFSDTFASASYTFPNDSNYRFLTFTYTNGGSTTTRFLRNTSGTFDEFYDATGTFTVYATTPTWTAGSTVTPNTVEGVPLFLESATTVKADNAQLVLKTTASSGSTKLQMQNSSGTELLALGYDPSTGFNYLNSSSNTLDLFGTSVGRYARFSSSTAQLNASLTPSFLFEILSSGNVQRLAFNTSNNALTINGGFINYTGTSSSTTTGSLYRNAAGTLSYVYTSPTPCTILSDSGSALTVNVLPMQSASSGRLSNSPITNDTSQNSIRYSISSQTSYSSDIIFTQTASGTAANTVAQTNISSTGVGSSTIGANYLRAGKTIRIQGKGFYSATGTPTGTLRLNFNGSTVLASSAITLAAVTNRGFSFEIITTIRTTGSSGTMFQQGEITLASSPTTLYGDLVSTTTTTINTTISTAITVTWQWSAMSPSNTITLTNLVIEMMV